MLCLGGQQGEGDAMVCLKNAALMLHHILEQDAASLWAPAIWTALMAYAVPQSWCQGRPRVPFIMSELRKSSVGKGDSHSIEFFPTVPS